VCGRCWGGGRGSNLPRVARGLCHASPSLLFPSPCSCPTHSPTAQAARLQTQAITLPPSTHRDLHLELVCLPPHVALQRPFTAEFRIVNRAGRLVGPLKVSFSMAEAAAAAAAGTSSPTLGSRETAAAYSGARGAAAIAAAAVVMDGAQSVVVEPVGPGAAANVTLRLLPLAVGPQLLRGIMVSDERDGRVYDVLQPLEVFVADSECAFT
jgi:hypothetical protein